MLTALAELWCVQLMAICDSFGPLLPHGWRMTLCSSSWLCILSSFIMFLTLFVIFRAYAITFEIRLDLATPMNSRIFSTRMRPLATLLEL